ncbi:homeobox protein Meis3-like [Bradysia coprophila]|uniref:homeobox protein Meis3-like n=1 Tax=Bradysia coprophila TaxID=38358 RepID=UPI00187DA00E|nr:homeobox protein Meis3-like [Bradysia coprophila]XP_037036022.1 homeobox protein Meis3-like [Bradysia coprophila]XP_037036023.1 homeobox protein Meis3-like [Bradysia coprophila]XP_037036024.1 homeobox protein Meis3-like [Bradysia coprophila]XP_037036025.1 homeobox protein Meis3-like [Bradysia coprophila]XP_037036026.1 homeobox protein Meis3-like [Bradysia coprophila]XP_037036027.1 homeobox protein Meis3-like [Bradysia coprophila]XP_037036028.1 homeobox protein Meis3-like [Bradysia coproph
MQENSISAPNANGIDQAQFEADKRAVYKHPLFSLLALMLEKCEQATQGYVPSNASSSSPNGSSNGNNCEGDSFSRDIQAFVQLLEKEKRPLLTNNAELDGLMIKALQVLRIHLLELEKVQELCRDFCTRYIACLRGKMQSENLLRSDYPLEHNNNLSNSNSPVNSPEQESLVQQGPYFGNADFLSATEGNDFSSIQGAYNIQNSNSTPENSFNGSSDISVIPPVLPVTIPQTTSPQQLQQPSILSSQILGSTPLSQIGCPPLPLDQYSNQLSPCGSSDEMDSELDSNNDDLSSNFSNNSGSKRQKRGILPKQATSVMRAWLFQHLVHPYPTEDEKRAIAAQTNLTLLQVNNWFINARRRILQPMLEHASDNNQNSARKKSSQQQTPSKRFWTDSASSPIMNPALIDPNIENISVNVNRAESDRLSAHKLAESYFSSDESNDSLVIDHDS